MPRGRQCAVAESRLKRRFGGVSAYRESGGRGAIRQALAILQKPITPRLISMTNLNSAVAMKAAIAGNRNRAVPPREKTFLSRPLDLFPEAWHDVAMRQRRPQQPRGSRASGFGLRASGFGLRASGFGLRASSRPGRSPGIVKSCQAFGKRPAGRDPLFPDDSLASRPVFAKSPLARPRAFRSRPAGGGFFRARARAS